MGPEHDPDIIAELYPPPVRRWVGVGMLYALGALLIYLGIFQPPPALVWMLFLLGLGALTLWFAERTRQATAHGLRLTEAGIFETNGRRIAALEDIQEIDRSLFAFKPSSGFLVITETVQDNAWRPGLYWIIGRRIGVGGVISRAQSKMMADTIAMILAERKAK